MLSRRMFLLAPLSVVGTVGYAFGVEPVLMHRVTQYRIQSDRWPQNMRLKVAVVADIHACEPWMGVRRIEHIVEMTNALGADVIVLLGDYVAGHHKITGIVPNRDWARALASLRAPLGVYAILGNHDWWADAAAQARGRGPIAARIALEEAGVPVLENDCVPIFKDSEKVWLAGLGDQLAIRSNALGNGEKGRGVDDLAKTLGMINDQAPIILLAHEPDIFPRVPARVSLTLSGHTHGGQVRLPGVRSVAPSELSRKYLYGSFVEDGRHLIVSGGLGCSWWPVRIGVPPEIVLVDIGG